MTLMAIINNINYIINDSINSPCENFNWSEILVQTLQPVLSPLTHNTFRLHHKLMACDWEIFYLGKIL